MRLKTLGELSLEGSDFKQSRPLLLLAYLCLEGAQERRYIAELFWPRSKNAINNLTTVLSRLKKVDASLIGGKGLLLQTNLSSDATELGEAFDQQDYESVLDLYDRRFLEGFYLKDIGSELEDWIYSQRESFAAKVRYARLSQAEDKAQKGLFQEAAKEAEQTYLQAKAGEPTESDLEKIYKLLIAGNSHLASEVKKEALSLGLDLSLSKDQVQQQFKTPILEGDYETQSRETSKAIVHHLPKQASPFVGRTSELERIVNLLAEPSCQLLTIVGPGGIGKTRLALATAEAQWKLGGFKNGVVFVSFVSVSSIDLMITAFGDAFGLAFVGKLDPKTQLFNYLADKNMLLVLDNLEHLLEGSRIFAELLKAAPSISLLATSREPLNLLAEQLFELSGLNTPNDDQELIKYDAGDLLVQCLQRRKPDFVLTGDSSQTIKEICLLVGGMPLALELAASWIRFLPLEEIAREISKGLDFLEANSRDIPERHRSIRAVFDYSWQLLNLEEQAAMRKLAVFQGGFNRETAKEVADVSFPNLVSLIDKSLLQITETGRYGRHPLIFQYSREKLAEHPEEKQQLEKQHSQYFINLIEENESVLRSLRRKEALAKLEEELPNIKKAWKWIVTHEKLNIIADLLLVFPQLLRQRPREAIEMCRQAREKLSVKNPKHYRALGRLNSIEATSQRLIYPLAQSHTLMQKGLDFSRQADDQEGIVLGLYLLGWNLWITEPSKATAIVEEGLALARQIDSPAVGTFLCALMLYKRKNAGFDEINAFYKEVIKELRELESPIQLAYGLTYQGSYLIYFEHLDEGQAILEESLRLCRRTGLDNVSIINFNELALLAYKRGDFKKDARLSKEAYHLSKVYGHLLSEAQAITGLGRAALGLKQLDQAKTYFKQALNHALESKLGPQRPLHTLTWVGVLHVQEEKFEKAIELLSFVSNSPFTEKRDQLEAMQQLAKVESRLFSEVFEKAKAKGESLEFEAVVQGVLNT